MQTAGDRTDFPSGTAVSGGSTADSSGINGPFTVCDVLMRERDALVYHRQMLERKREELEQSLQRQRSKKAVCPALFVFPSAEALSRATQSDRVQSTLSALTTFHPVPMLRSLELDAQELSEVVIQNISRWEAMGQLEYISIRLHQVTPTLKLLCSLTLLRSLDLSHATITIEDLRDLSPISQIKTLEVVKMSKYYELRGVGTLKSLPRLKELDLSHNHITDEEIRLLSECHTLVKIDLHWCSALTNVNPLSSIATLEEINLSGCTALTHVGALGKLPVLKEVDLKCTRITDKDVRQLSESDTLVKIDLRSCDELTNVNAFSSIATLEVINLSRCTSITHVGALGKLPALKEVDLSFTYIRDEEIRLLSESNTLVKIDLCSCRALTNVNVLSSIATLEEIDLSWCTSLIHVASLGKLSKLMSLNLFDTYLDNEEVDSLKSLRKQLGLPSIDIYIDVG